MYDIRQVRQACYDFTVKLCVANPKPFITAVPGVTCYQVKKTILRQSP